MKKIVKQVPLWLLLIVPAVIFLFLRLYKIESSLLFFNDMGRDFLALYRWQETGRPPLLGPLTSSLPSNQSALYFYLLYPLYLLTNQSLFSTIYTVILFYLVFLVAGVFLLRKRPDLLKILAVVSFLIAIHPQFVLQHRFVWNPSFVAPLLITAFFSFHLLSKKPSPLLIFIFSMSIAAATALTYSVVPVLLAFLILAVIRIPKQAFRVFAYTVASFLFLNLPTIFFELRHNFILTKLLFGGERLAQSQNSLIEKLNRLFDFLIFSITAAVWYGFRHYQKEGSSQTKRLFQDAGLLFVITSLVTLIVPFSIHAHFVFGFLSLGMIIIALLPHKVLIPLLLLFSAFWLRPEQLAGYFKCQGSNEPMFVSLQAGFHPYHNGPEFRYLLRAAGCKIRDIEQEPKSARLMAVVVDASKYEHGKTRYYELDLFGKSKEIKVYQCLPNLEVHILSTAP